MDDNTALQQELSFRLSLLRLVTNAPFNVSNEAPSSKESSQIESLCALVAAGPNSR